MFFRKMDSEKFAAFVVEILEGNLSFVSRAKAASNATPEEQIEFADSELPAAQEQLDKIIANCRLARVDQLQILRPLREQAEKNIASLRSLQSLRPMVERLKKLRKGFATP